MGRTAIVRLKEIGSIICIAIKKMGFEIKLPAQYQLCDPGQVASHSVPLACPPKNESLSAKGAINMESEHMREGRGIAQRVEHLPRICEALGSVP